MTPIIRITEPVFRMLQRHPFEGLTQGELAAALALESGRVGAALCKLRYRGLVARDPETRRWSITVDNARFRAVGARVAPAKEPGVTAEDLAWMRKKRAEAADRQRRRAAMQP